MIISNPDSVTAHKITTPYIRKINYISEQVYEADTKIWRKHVTSRDWFWLTKRLARISQSESLEMRNYYFQPTANRLCLLMILYSKIPRLSTGF